jgi:hypothetical protein
MVRLGGTAVRAGLPLLKGPPRVPDPGQCVDLLTEAGSWRRGFRAISEPSTSERGEVVVWVATEDEYRAAQREGRSAVGVPWPTERMVACSSGVPWRLPPPEPQQSLERARRPWWRWGLTAYLDEGRAALGPRIIMAMTLILAAVAVCYLLAASGVLGGGR